MVKILGQAIQKTVQIVFCLMLVLSMAACAQKTAFKIDSDTALRVSLQKAVDYPETSFIVVSDTHIFDPDLGTSGKEFEEYLSNDRKLVKESPEIVDAAVAEMISMGVPFVLCPGDLTKDGERASHLLMAQSLAKLKASGKKVYVVPGNHDVRNGHSYRYVDDGKERVPNVSPEEFVEIYNEYGYQDALQRDSNSLSYVAEPVNGLWLLALDSTRHKENIEDEEPIVDGKFSQQTLAWIEASLAEAAKANKAVLIIMHHGVVEHYKGQQKNYGEYIVDDYEDVSRLFAAYNARMVFTGHYHAQDVTLETWTNGGSKFLFDIETGSLVTHPCPWRIVKIGANQQVDISTRYVTSIKSHPSGFPEYGRDYLEEGIAGIAVKTLMGYGISQDEAEQVSSPIASAFVAHYSGDENLPAGQEILSEQGLSPLGWVVIQMRKDLVYGLWEDLPPPDNSVMLDMKTGAWR
ncbi:MAG: metallophosphoesterase [Dehalococcoidia bacterium]|nr:metallophosphoesterase [Dehalococcoidia bacterium]